MRFEEVIQFFRDMDKIVGTKFSKDIHKSHKKPPQTPYESFDIWTASNSFTTFYKPTRFSSGHVLGGYASSLTWDIEHYDRRKKETVVGDIQDKTSYIEAVATIMWNLSSENIQKLFNTDPKFYKVYYFNNKSKIRALDKKYYLAKHKEITVTAKELKILKILHDDWLENRGSTYGMSEYLLRNALKQKTFPYSPMWQLQAKDLIYIREEEVFKRGRLDKFYNIGYKGTDILKKRGIIK